MTDKQESSGQNVIRLAELPDLIQEDIRLIIEYIAVQEGLPNNEVDSADTAESRKSD